MRSMVEGYPRNVLACDVRMTSHVPHHHPAGGPPPPVGEER